jgi:hypothetical protein
MGMTKGIDWQARVKGILKAELKRRNVSYQQLADRLAPLGIRETPQNIANKISRGGFRWCSSSNVSSRLAIPRCG